MSIFVCPNEGSDGRWFRFLICPLQNLLSWKSDKAPSYTIRKSGQYDGKPYVSFGLILWPFYIVRQRDNGDGRFRLIRFGWRFDRNWTGYIFPTAARKWVSEPMEYGF